MNEGSAPARLIHTGSRGKSALVSPSRAGGVAVGSRGMVASLLPPVGHNVKRWSGQGPEAAGDSRHRRIVLRLL
jgi:hypothetical protein